VLGGFWVIIWFLTWFSTWFSQWKWVDIIENRTKNRPPYLTWMRTGHENQFLFFLFFLNWTNKTSIWFSIFQFTIFKQQPLPREVEVFKVRDNGSCIKPNLNFIFFHNDVICLAIMFFFCWLCFVLFFWLFFSCCIFYCIGVTTCISVVIHWCYCSCWHCCSCWCSMLHPLHWCCSPRNILHIGVVFHVCYCFSLHCFVVTFHPIVFMFFSRVVATLCALVSLLFLHWCSTLLTLVVGTPFFLCCYVVLLVLLR